MQPQVCERCNEHNNTFQETNQSCFKHCAKNIPTWITSVLITSFSFSVTWKLSAFVCLVMWGKREACVCVYEKTNQIQLASCEWCLDGGCAALFQENSTAASFSSTSCESRGYAAHWKVHKATLKTKPFTNSNFRCGFLFASLFFIICSDGGSRPPYEPISSLTKEEREKERKKKERVSG